MCTCLDVIGVYISWIDVALIANKQFVDVLLRFMMQRPLLRETACDCVHEIVCKGMEPTAKTTLVESFASVLETAGVLKVADVRCRCSRIALLVTAVQFRQILCRWDLLWRYGHWIQWLKQNSLSRLCLYWNCRSADSWRLFVCRYHHIMSLVTAVHFQQILCWYYVEKVQQARM